MLSILEQAISRYGGSDLAYKNKLKETIRNQMGYNNYMVKLGQETGAPASIGDIKGLSPAGINARISSRFGMQDENINTQSAIAGAFDTAAGTIASERIAAAKAGASARQNAMGLENGVAFSPSDELDRKILAYMQNPKNSDGSVKSLQQFESELNTYYNENPDATMIARDAQGNMVPRSIFSGDTIKQKIESRIPKDFIGNEDKYFLMSQGYSSKQAEENAGALRRNSMTPEEQLAWDNAHPVMSKILGAMGGDTALIGDIGLVRDEATGEMRPKKNLQQLIADHPGIDPKIIEIQAKPVFKNLLEDDIQKELPIKEIEDKIASKNLTINDYASFMQSEDYKAFKDAILPMYGGMFTAQELDTIIYNKLMGGL